MPTPKIQRAHCPACRALTVVRFVGAATIGKQHVRLAQCKALGCDLIWVVRESPLVHTTA